MKGNEKGGAGLLASSVTIQHTSIATGLTYTIWFVVSNVNWGDGIWLLLIDC